MNSTGIFTLLCITESVNLVANDLVKSPLPADNNIWASSELKWHEKNHSIQKKSLFPMWP